VSQLVERMPAVARKGPHLTGPASRFDSFRPFAAHQNMRTVNLIECAMAPTLLRDWLFYAADAHDERFTFHARDGVQARHLQKIRHVLSVVDLVEERLAIIAAFPSREIATELSGLRTGRGGPTSLGRSRLNRRNDNATFSSKVRRPA
jgi:hypothetical protein